MKTLIRLLTSLLACLLFYCGSSLATETNITIYDGLGSGTGWNGAQEDQEVEPGNIQSQIWDLEGFFLNGSTLTVVSGFNLFGVTQNFEAGDIFFSTGQSPIYGYDNVTLSSNGNYVVNNDFDYDYVMDIEWDTGSYNVYSLNSASTFTVWYRQNDESNPFRYNDGGSFIRSGSFLQTYSNLNDAQIVNYGWKDQNDNTILGGNHYAASMDIGFLPSNTQFWAHLTVGCGNDNLMGSSVTGGYDPVPEPATMVLLGAGLLCLGGLSRKHFFKNNA